MIKAGSPEGGSFHSASKTSRGENKKSANEQDRTADPLRVKEVLSR